MSTALGIASVSAVLRQLLAEGLNDHDLTHSLGEVKVTALPPDRINTDDTAISQLNLFLYQVTPNLGWKNVDLPSRDFGGRSIAAPPLALDLHYLISAHGALDFHGEILLGYAMQLLHENPVLTRGLIRKILGEPSLVSAGGGLPATFEALSGSALADQQELIKISLQSISTDEAFRLWTAMQGHYRATAAYHVSVVLIESRQKVRAPLPVLRRGKEDRGPDALASVNRPVIETVRLPHGQGSAFIGDELSIKGSNLAGLTALRFTHEHLPAPLEIKVPALSDPTGEIKVVIADAGTTTTAPDGTTVAGFWISGSYHLVAVVDRNGQSWTSPPWRLSVAPRILTALATITQVGTRNDVELTITCTPPIRLALSSSTVMRFDQPVELLFGERPPTTPQPPPPPPADPALAPTETNTCDFIIERVAKGVYLPRLRIDGVEMPIVDWTVVPPVFDGTQTVVVP